MRCGGLQWNRRKRNRAVAVTEAGSDGDAGCNRDFRRTVVFAVNGSANERIVEGLRLAAGDERLTRESEFHMPGFGGDTRVNRGREVQDQSRRIASLQVSGEGGGDITDEQAA